MDPETRPIALTETPCDMVLLRPAPRRRSRVAAALGVSLVGAASLSTAVFQSITGASTSVGIPENTSGPETPLVWGAPASGPLAAPAARAAATSIVPTVADLALRAQQDLLEPSTVPPPVAGGTAPLAGVPVPRAAVPAGPGRPAPSSVSPGTPGSGSTSAPPSSSTGTQPTQPTQPTTQSTSAPPSSQPTGTQPTTQPTTQSTTQPSDAPPSSTKTSTTTPGATSTSQPSTQPPGQPSTG